MILATALTCLAMNVYMEARGEPITGQYAVAQVTMRRAHGESGKVCEVVMASKQFSWTNGKVVRVRGGLFVLKSKFLPKDKVAWAIAKGIADNTLNHRGEMPDYSNGAMFYHASYVSPKWSWNMRVTSLIGRHIFYTKGQNDKSPMTKWHFFNWRRHDDKTVWNCF